MNQYSIGITAWRLIATVLVLVLLLSLATSAQPQTLTTEDIFRRYLVSRNEDIARSIIKSDDTVYGLYCKASLTKDDGEKKQLLSRFIALKPAVGLANAHGDRGLLYYVEESYDSALIDYNKAIELQPDDVYYWYFRGAVHKNLKKYELALRDFSKAIELDARMYLAYHMRGLVYDISGQQQQALADYTKSIELKNSYAPAYMLRGALYEGMGEYEKALADLREAMRLDKRYEKGLQEQIEAIQKKMQEKK